MTATEKAKSYIPGTQESKEKKAEQGTHGTGTGTGGYSSGTGTGSGYNTGRTGTGTGYGTTGTDSYQTGGQHTGTGTEGMTGAEKAKSYLPGTAENREKKAEQGTGTGDYDSTRTGTGGYDSTRTGGTAYDTTRTGTGTGGDYGTSGTTGTGRTGGDYDSTTTTTDTSEMSTAEKLKAKIPGTAAYKATH